MSQSTVKSITEGWPLYVTFGNPQGIAFWFFVLTQHQSITDSANAVWTLSHLPSLWPPNSRTWYRWMIFLITFRVPLKLDETYKKWYAQGKSMPQCALLSSCLCNTLGENRPLNSVIYETAWEILATVNNLTEPLYFGNTVKHLTSLESAICVSD